MAGFVKRFLKGFIRWIWINATHSVNTDVPYTISDKGEITYHHVDMCDVGFRDNANRKIGYIGSDLVMRKLEGSEEYKRCTLTYMQALGDPVDESKQTTFSIVSSIDGTVKQIETNATLSTKLNWCTTNIMPYADDHIASKKYVDDKTASIQASIKYLPDYSKAVSLSGSTYTATANGFVVLACYGATKVNGVTISNNQEIHMYSLPVSSGDTVSAYKILSFIPFK